MIFIKPNEIFPYIPIKYRKHSSITPYTRSVFFSKLFWGRIESIIELFLKLEKRFQKVIEVGGGYGIFSANFKLNFPKSEVFLLDLAPKERVDIIKKILANHFKINLKYNPGCDITKKIPHRDNSFDLVFALDVLEHVENPDAALNEILRILKKNGLLFISVPTESKLLNFSRKLYNKFSPVRLNPHWQGMIKSEVEFYNLLIQKNIKLSLNKKYPFNFLPKLFSYDIFYLVSKKV